MCHTKKQKENIIDIFDWQKVNGLAPVIVQDYLTGKVLMLAYMSKESLQKTLDGGKMIYYSRTRNCLWTKGETSGCFQYIKSIFLDCDNDSLLIKVKQIGNACHTGNKTCFYKQYGAK